MFQSINHHIGPLPALALPELSNWSSATAGSAWWIFHVHPQPLFHGLYTLPLSTGYSTWASRLLSLMNQKHEHPSWCFQPIQKPTGLWPSCNSILSGDWDSRGRRPHDLNSIDQKLCNFFKYCVSTPSFGSQWNYESWARLCALFRHLHNSTLVKCRHFWFWVDH